MAFHYLDRILEITPNKSIRGIKNITRSEDFLYWHPNGERYCSPGVVTEALAQLGSFLAMKTVDFTKRPVLLADEFTEYLDFIKVGDQVDLFVELLDLEDDIWKTRSYAEINGKLVVDSHCCRSYMLDLEDFIDKDQALVQFKNLFRPEFKDLKNISHKYAVSDSQALYIGKDWHGLKMVDYFIEHEPYKKTIAQKSFSNTEDVFLSHFPNKPVVPGVLLVTCIAEVCQSLIKETIDSSTENKALLPKYSKNLKCRKFVYPGDQCIINAELKTGDPTKANSDITIDASVFVNNKRVLQSELGFTVIAT